MVLQDNYFGEFKNLTDSGGRFQSYKSDLRVIRIIRNFSKTSYFKSIAIYGFGTWGDFNMDKHGMIGFHYYLEPIRGWQLSENFSFIMTCKVPDYKKQSFFLNTSWYPYRLKSNISMRRQYNSEKKRSVFTAIQRKISEKFANIILIQN